MRSNLILLTIAPSLIQGAVYAQRAPLPSLPAPVGIPSPGPVTDQPYSPGPILPEGVIVPLYPVGSSFLKADRVREAEQYNMSQSVPGRIAR